MSDRDKVRKWGDDCPRPGRLSKKKKRDVLAGPKEIMSNWPDRISLKTQLLKWVFSLLVAFFMKFKNEFQIIYFNTFSGELSFWMKTFLRWPKRTCDHFRLIVLNSGTKHSRPVPFDGSMDFHPFFVVAYNSFFEIILVTECGGK